MQKQIYFTLTLHLFLSFIITAACSGIFYRIYFSEVVGSIEGNSGLGIIIIMGIIISLLLMVAALPSYMNLKAVTRNHLSKSLLAFFLLPALVSCFIIYTGINSDITIVFITPVIIFWIIYIFVCFLFRRKYKTVVVPENEESYDPLSEFEGI